MSKTKKTLYIIVGIVLILSVVLHLVTEGFHQVGMYIAVGLVGALILVLLGKVILPAMLAKKPDYYDGGSDE